MKRFIKTTISIALIINFSTLLAQVDASQIDSIVNSNIKMDGPGVIVLVKQRGKTLYEKAFGNANIELNVDMNPENVFNIASVSKEFTAMSILQLAEKNQLSLEDNLNKYIPDYTENGDAIKIKHLLSHTSGLRTQTDTIWANTDARKYIASLEEVIKFFKKDTILFNPGDRHDYSNINFTLLGHIVEKVSGKSYPDYIEEYIFKPLNMTNSSIPVEGQVIPNLATGYEYKEDEIVYARYHSLNQTWGTSGLHTTVGDLAKWYEGLMNSKVVSRETLIKAWTPFTLNSGEKAIYGFGFYPDMKFNKTSIVHNGFIFGYSTSDMYFPEDDLLILVASNISEIKVINTNTIAYDIAANIYKDEALKLNQELLDTYVGTYNMTEGFKTKVFRKESTLYVEVAGNTANELIATSETKFKVKDFPAGVEFEAIDENGMKIFLSRGPSKFEGIKE